MDMSVRMELDDKENEDRRGLVNPISSFVKRSLDEVTDESADVRMPEERISKELQEEKPNEVPEEDDVA